jgi:hypothetical protein
VPVAFAWKPIEVALVPLATVEAPTAVLCVPAPVALAVSPTAMLKLPSPLAFASAPAAMFLLLLPPALAPRLSLSASEPIARLKL